MNPSFPDRIYKYTPSKYVDDVTKKGTVLFRNLSSFRQMEDRSRGDHLEGHHRDNPDRNVTVTSLNTGVTISGDFSFLNSTNTEKTFVYCLSTLHDERLYGDFSCDACIEIIEPAEFIRRVRIAVRRLVSVDPAGLISGSVHYYTANKPSELDIKNPKKLVFLKDEEYSYQREYRLVFGRKNAFNLEQKIVVNSAYDFHSAAKHSIPKKKCIMIGPIQELVTVHRC